MIDYEDKELIKKAKKNIKEFDLLYNKYFPRINNFVYHRVYSKEIREEIVSNTFFKAMKKLYQFRYFESKKSSFSAWLYRIAINEINQNYHKYKKSNRVIENVKIENNTRKNEDQMHYETNYENVKKQLKNLSPLEQNLIVLKYFEKKSYQEIAEIYKKKITTLKVKTHRALKKIKKNLNLEEKNAKLG